MANGSGAKAWDHTSLTVSNLDEAIRLFREAFGYEVVFEARGLTAQMESVTGVAGARADLVHLMAPISSHRLELVEYGGIDSAAAPAPLVPGTAHVSFQVEELDASIKALETLGASRMGEVTRFSEGRSAYLVASAGFVVELEEGSIAELPPRL